MIKQILQYPNPVLNQVSKQLLDTDFNDSLRRLFDDMRDTLIDSKGVGLSAIQIGVPLRACVIRDGQDSFLEICNPVVLEKSGDIYQREGCLSCRELFVSIHAPEDTIVEFVTPELEYKKIFLEGLLARCIQHELAHMAGSLIVDSIPKYKKSDVLKKWKRGTK